MRIILALAATVLFILACGAYAQPDTELLESKEIDTDSLESDTCHPKPEAVVELAVVDLVERGVALILAEGSTEDGLRAVFEKIEDRNGDYVQGELYLYVGDFKGVMLANTALPELDGQNLLESDDPQTAAMMDEMIHIAVEDGTGWLDYLWPFPGTHEVLPKRAYIARPGDMNLFVGCGYYFSTGFARSSN